jgi:hypothetical protein
MTQAGPALTASDDPLTIEQFSHALEESSISPNVCPAAVGF